MVRYLSLLSVVAAFGLLLQVVSAEDKEAKKEFKAKCVVAPAKDAKMDKFAEYKGGKVYFCCGGCPEAFKKDTAKFATKANHQLVVTGQAHEVKCPLTGKELNPDTKIEVAGTEVTFCCNGCKGKVSKAKPEEQLELVFGDKHFDQGFEVKKAE